MPSESMAGIIGGLLSTIAVLALVIKMMLDKRNNKVGNPIDINQFILDCTEKHTEQLGKLDAIIDSLRRIEEKIR